MVISTFKLPQSPCPSCGENGRFVGMERHESLRNTNVLTFECERCGDYAVEKESLKTPGKLVRNPKPS
jgi:hypothetical protein